MNKVKKSDILLLPAIVGFFILIYGCYYIGKSVSYKLFYKGMVQEEIEQMVKPSCLINKGK